MARESGEIVFHTGWPKTGSTAFQQQLYENADLLREAGIYVPENVYDPTGKQADKNAELRTEMRGRNHSLIHGELTDLTSHQRRVSNLESDQLHGAFENAIQAFEESGCRTMILSSEGMFWGSSKLALDKFPAAARAHKIRAVAYARRYDTYFPSLYRQQVKSGTITNRNFEDFVTQRRKRRSGEMGPVFHMKDYAERLGIPIQLRSYDEAKKTLIRDAMTACGVPEDLELQEASATVANPSFSDAQTVFILEMYRREVPVQIAAGLARRMQKLNKRGKLNLVLPDITFVSHATRVQLAQAYNEDMAEVEAYAGYRPAPVSLPPESPRRMAERLSDDEWGRALKSLPRKLSEQIKSRQTHSV